MTELSNETNMRVTDEEWNDYKKKFKKSYGDQEDNLRRSIYVESKKKIEEHNKKFETGKVTWSMGINQFADRKPEETCGCGVRPPRKADLKKKD